jgi:ATP-binding cassette subfamily C protein CydC
MIGPILRLARPYLPRLVGAGLLAAATDLAGLALMGTATWLLVTAAGRPPLQALTVAIVSVRALAIGRGVLRYAERLTGHDAVLRMLTDVRARVFATLAASRETRVARVARGTVEPSEPPRAHSGDTLSRLVSDVDAVQDLMLRVLVPGAAAAVVGSLSVAGVALASPAAALALAAGLLVAGGALPAVAARWSRRTADQVAPLRGALAVDAVDLTVGAADLAAFGATGTARAAARRRAAELARLERRLAVTGWAVDAAGVLVAGVTAAAVTVTALRAGTDATMVAVLAVVTLTAVEACLALLGAARRWTEIRGSLARIAPLLTAPAGAPPAAGGPESRERSDRAEWSPTGRPSGDPARASGANARGAVRLDGVTVRYRPDGPPALSGVDLALPPGHRLAVVGPSGAGKSTLLAVLTGTVRPAAGAVTLAGTDLAEYDPDELPRAVGGLLADAYVFHATVRENLLLGNGGAAPEELAEACRAAGLLAWVRRQPDGFDTVVGADGGQLSGGQRQRLALARALLAAPGVLLLDEPTEGLDPAAADEVLAGALAAAGNRTVVLVTHRLSGLTGFDEVAVLDGGRVVRRGRPEELADEPGWFREHLLAQRAAERGYLSLG